MVVVVKKEGKGVKCEVCGARSDETMQDCRSPVVEKMSNPIQFLQVRSVISTQSSSASLNRKEGGRKEEKSGLSPNRLGQLRPPMRMRIESVCVLT